MDPLAELLGTSPGIEALREQVRQLLRAWPRSRRPPPVLLDGETGTGKGLLARLLHRASPRSPGPFVILNCAAVPATLLEAELFGYERGAFTDARQAKPGMFQVATGGTLFLDEIGLLPLALQAKLLSAIEDRAVRRLGGIRAEPVDVWILAATNEPLREAIRAGAFREDLYYRLAVLTLTLPPLRERGDDIFLLAESFLAQACADYGLPVRSIGADMRTALRAYPWPGNVRELANVIERMVLLGEDARITAARLALPDAQEPERGAAAAALLDHPGVQSSRDLMRQHLLSALTQTGWNISRTAAILGISRNTVTARIMRYGLQRHPAILGDRSAPTPPVAGEHAVPRETAIAASHWEVKRLSLLAVRLGDHREGDFSLTPALNSIVDKIQSFGGRIEGTSPASISAVFGIEPSEQPAALAAHSAMAIRNALRRSEPQLSPVTMGLHVADVLVREDPVTPTLDVEGSRRAWNAIDGLLANAQPNTTVVTEVAAARLRRRFALAGPGTKGSGYRIEGLWHARRSRRSELGRFAGRDDELALLKGRLALARRGVGQVIDIVGEVGIGKSRLLLELISDDSTTDDASYLEGRCSPATGAMPFYPVLSILRDVCGISEMDSPDVVRDGLATVARAAGKGAADVLAMLTQLLTSETGPRPEMEPGLLKRRFFGAIRDVLVRQSYLSGGLLLVVEDLHWIDATSEECLASLVEAVSAAPILLVTTYRPGYRSRWAGRANVTQLPLPPLSAEESVDMIEGILKARAVPANVVERIVARAEGNPLFLEELSHVVLERDDINPSDYVPSSIGEVISLRMSRLPPWPRQLLGTCAVIGREVPIWLLRHVSQLSEESLEEALKHLQHADFLNSARVGADSGYVFKHALVQEVAYEALLESTKQQHHQRIAQVLAERFPDVVEAQPELLAYHYTAAGSTEQAIPFWRRAGERAAARSGNVEAIGHLGKGLELLATLPETQERTRQELELQLALGSPLMIAKSQAAPEVERVYRRAHELAERLDDRALGCAALMGLARFAISAGHFDAAREVAEQALAVADQLDDPVLRWQSHLILGSSGFYVGRLESARSHLEQGLALHRPDDSRFQTFITAGHPQVHGLSHLGHTLWLLGYPDQALQRNNEALAASRRSPHPYTRARALYYAGVLYRRRREPAAARECAEEVIALSREHGFTRWLGRGFVILGSALVEQGSAAEGVTEMQRGIAVCQSVADEVGMPALLAALAQGHATIGDALAGLSVVKEALTVAGRTREASWDAELIQLRGEMLLPNLEAAEQCFDQALAIARDQRARSLVLRAALSMSRLRARQGRRADGLRTLAEAYGWFTEGFDTRDLQDAKAVLDAG